MFGGLIQMGELVVNQNLHPFLVFFVLCWAIFLVRILAARNHRAITLSDSASLPNITTSALIMTLGDEPDLFKKCLDSVKAQTVKFTEVFVVMDSNECSENLKVASGSGFRLFFDRVGNKRSAYAGAFKQSTGEIVAMLSGDTVYAENMLEEALKAFAYPKIGGVGFRQRIYDRDRNLIRKFADIMYSLRYKITYACLSSKGVLLCTTGETAFFRRAPIEKHLDEFVNESFWGRRCVIGDDRFLTSMVLKEGYDVVLQPSTEPSLTDCPNNLRDFVNQQLRWYRSNQRYSAKTLFQNWIPGKSPILKVHLAGFLILPYLWLVVLAWWVFNSLTRAYPVEILTASFVATLPIWLAGLLLAMFIKTSPHFAENRKDLYILPSYILFVILIIIPTFVYALITIRNQGSWETKRNGKSSNIWLLFFPALILLALPWMIWENLVPAPALAGSY